MTQGIKPSPPHHTEVPEKSAVILSSACGHIPTRAVLPVCTRDHFRNKKAFHVKPRKPKDVNFLLKSRNHPSISLRYRNETAHLDCAQGGQDEALTPSSLLLCSGNELCSSVRTRTAGKAAQQNCLFSASELLLCLLLKLERRV